MEALTPERLTLLLARAGLDPAATDVDLLRGLFQRLLERLEALHAADLEQEEVAGILTPPWGVGTEVAS